MFEKLIFYLNYKLLIQKMVDVRIFSQVKS